MSETQDFLNKYIFFLIELRLCFDLQASEQAKSFCHARAPNNGGDFPMNF